MKKKIKKIVSAQIVAGIIVTSSLTSVVSAQGNNDIYKAIESMNNTIKSKSELEIKTGFDIAPDVDTKTDEMVSIIVELKGESVSVAKAKDSKVDVKSVKEKAKSNKNKFKNDLEKMKKTMPEESKIEFGYEYDTVFNGVAMKLPGKEVAKLLESDQVKTIWNNAEVKLDLPNENSKLKAENNQVEPFMVDSINDIGVDKLHEEGIKGKGIKVGVLDTGIDYNHPDLKENYKGGYDFVDGDNDPMETTREEWKASGYPEFNPQTGSSYYTSHGTHVSGTIAGNGASKSEYAITGVAPESDLYVYRVLGPYGSGPTDGIMAAVERAVNDGMDVINLSLGSGGANPYSPLTLACNNAMLSGVATVLANGNAGPNISTLGTPAVSPLSISVGASTTAITLDLYNITLGESSIEGQTLSKNFEYSITDFNDIEIVDCGKGATGDFNGKDLKDKIALIQRGDLSFDEKLLNAKNSGAKFAIVYNDIDGEIPYYLGESAKYIPSIGLSKEEGESLKTEIGKGNNKLSLKATGKTKTEKDLLGDFSSRGPAPLSYEIKPDLSAPGVSILSTYPEFINDEDETKENYTSAYARISGTSMAAPHISGVAALIKSQHKDYDPFDIKLSLMNTANDAAIDYGVNEVGAGIVDAYQAVNPLITIFNTQESKTLDKDANEAIIEHETGSISFGRALVDGEDKSLKDELTIENRTDKTKTFEVSVEYVAPDKAHGGLDANKNGVKLQVKSNAVAIKNKDTKLDVNLVIPKGAELGLYQGYINLVNRQDKNETYQVPFSVKVTKPGIEPLMLYRKSMTNDEANIEYSLGQAGIGSLFSFRSTMERIDIIVRDGESNEMVGYIGGYDTKDIPVDTTLMMDFLINQWGSVYQYKDGKIQPYKTPLNEGYYTVEMIGKGDDGKEYTSLSNFVIDNTPVKNTYKLNGKDIKQDEIIEIKDELLTKQTDTNGVEHEAVWINGNLYDSAVDTLLEKGHTKLDILDTNINQGLNSIGYRLNENPWVGGSFKVDESGNYKFGVTKSDVEKRGYEVLDMEKFDMAYAKEPRLDDSRIVFIKEGMPYAKFKYDKETINKDEEANLTVSINNLKDIKGGTLNFNLLEDYDVSSIGLKEEYKDNYELKYTTGKVEYGYKKLNIELISKENAPHISGNVDLMDITLKLKDDTNSMLSSRPINMKEINLIDKDEAKVSVIAKHTQNLFANAKSEISGEVTGEAINLFATELLNPERYSMKASLKDSDGNNYKVDLKEIKSMLANGRMGVEAKNLPVTDKYFELTIDIPGHFEEKLYFKPSKTVDGKLVAKNVSMSRGLMNYNLAGDVNNDDVIDIKDAKEIAKMFNKEYKNNDLVLDLTQNGTVNNKDMYFVVKNFGMINPYANKGVKPEGTKEELQKILDDIKYEKPEIDDSIDN